VAHNKWTISFCYQEHVYHTHIENFYNISTVPKTLIKMFALHCNNWSRSFPKLSYCPIIQIHHVYLWHHEWCLKEYLTWTMLQRILILYRIWHLHSINSSTFIEHSTKMKPLLSNILCKLCSQTARWSTFFQHHPVYTWKSMSSFFHEMMLS